MPRESRPPGPAHTLQQQLGHQIRHWREQRSLTIPQLADLVGRNRRTISGAEEGRDCPSAAVMMQLEHHLASGGILMSSYEAVLAGRAREKLNRELTQFALSPDASEADSSEFLGETIADGTIMAPGQMFEKTWTIRNVGTVTWTDRRLARIGIAAGHGLITTPAFIPMPTTKPGEDLVFTVPCTAQFVQGTSIAAFKMVDTQNRLYFPFSRYTIGLQVQVTVVDRQPPSAP